MAIPDAPTRGARAVRLDLQAMIETHHKAALVVARDEWGWTARQMPDLQFVDAYETEVIDDPPQLAVNVADVPDVRPSELDPSTGREVLEVDYNVNLYLWVKRGPSPRDAMALRDDYITVIRSLVLGRQGINSAQDYRVNQRTLREAYSEPARAKGDRWLAAGRVTFRVTHDETLWRAEGFYVDTAEVEATLLPRTTDEE